MVPGLSKSQCVMVSSTIVIFMATPAPHCTGAPSATCLPWGSLLTPQPQVSGPPTTSAPSEQTEADLSGAGSLTRRSRGWGSWVRASCRSPGVTALGLLPSGLTFPNMQHWGIRGPAGPGRPGPKSQPQVEGGFKSTPPPRCPGRRAAEQDS